MNVVTLIGNITRDIELRYTTAELATTRFNIAVDGKPKADGTKRTDFPTIIVFGNQAESCATYLKKGSKVAIVGHISTGSYEKDGVKIYTTDVVADRVEFLDRPEAKKEEAPTGFTVDDLDIPF